MKKAILMSSIQLCICIGCSQAFTPVVLQGWMTTNIARATTSSTTKTALQAKKKKKGGKSGGAAATSGLKGFGSTTKSSSVAFKDIKDVTIDRSPSAMNFYSYLERNGAGSNLKRVALGYFSLKDQEDVTLRGVVALKTIKKGEIIIEIPYEAAWNLGKENSDPTLPGTIVLQEYCHWISGTSSSSENNEKKQEPSSKRDLSPYLEMLPPFRSSDVLGSTDFFSDEALDMLQSPQIKKETLARKDKTLARFERDIKPMMEISKGLYRWKKDDDNEDGLVTEEHLRWAVWLVTSRVLTVQGEEGTGDQFRLMIPLIDMCNHDRSSKHVLTGRAVPGGTLKVVAGKTVKVGEQINIVYGGGVVGNDRFIQDYGFLDTLSDDGAEAYGITGKILMGKTRIVEGAGAKNGRPTLMPVDEREKILAVLDETTLEEDVSLLTSSGNGMDDDVRTALEYRIGVKKALKRLGYGLIMAP